MPAQLADVPITIEILPEAQRMVDEADERSVDEHGFLEMVESSGGAEPGRVVAEVGLGHRPREVERTVPIALGIFRLASLGLLATPTLLFFCEA